MKKWKSDQAGERFSVIQDEGLAVKQHIAVILIQVELYQNGHLLDTWIAKPIIPPSE
ncbi:hypothetical protein [Pseudomonas veronii]|uniref:hypothetical protein n=1 Tax=Pseudomonas veronii TaxID=76761 RepID=UPI00163BB3B8|nr:hypothetical protein [Pseudomonas veronii]